MYQAIVYFSMGCILVGMSAVVALDRFAHKPTVAERLRRVAVASFSVGGVVALIGGFVYTG